MPNYTLIGFSKTIDTRLKWLPSQPRTSGHTWKLRIMVENKLLLQLRLKEITVVCYTNSSPGKIEAILQKEMFRQHKVLTNIVDELELFILDKKIANPK